MWRWAVSRGVTAGAQCGVRHAAPGTPGLPPVGPTPARARKGYHPAPDFIFRFLFFVRVGGLGMAEYPAGGGEDRGYGYRTG